VTWLPFEQGSTIGARGSEEGTILLDEEHDLGARITLERECRKIPFAITCGIYGWMVHTTYASSRDEADALVLGIRADLERILALIPMNFDPDVESRSRNVSLALSQFVGKYQ
jgi:hypothetical protein